MKQSKYWGEMDTNILFCEQKYNISSYISEFHNTWSNLFFILLPLYLLNKGYDKALIYISIGIGIGSTIFHTTSRYYGEIIDEFFMFLLLAVYIYKLHVIPNFILYPQLVALMYMCFFLYVTTNSYIFFQITVMAGVFIILFKLRHYYKCTKNADSKKLIIRSAYSIIIGKFFWITDQYYLNNNECDKYPWISMCHSLWHLFAAWFIYYQIVLYKLIIGQSNGSLIISP